MSAPVTCDRCGATKTKTGKDFTPFGLLAHLKACPGSAQDSAQELVRRNDDQSLRRKVNEINAGSADDPASLSSLREIEKESVSSSDDDDTEPEESVAVLFKRFKSQMTPRGRGIAARLLALPYTSLDQNDRALRASIVEELRGYAEETRGEDILKAAVEQRQLENDPDYQRRLSEERQEAEKVRRAEEVARWEASMVAITEAENKRVVEGDQEDKQGVADRTAVQEEREWEERTARWNEERDEARLLMIALGGADPCPEAVKFSTAYPLTKAERVARLREKMRAEVVERAKKLRAAADDPLRPTIEKAAS